MRRYTKAEGYTLIELLIVIAIVGLVAAGIVGVYQVSQDIYIRATALEDAQLGARAGLDRMASELRLIGSYWVGAATSAQGNAIITPATATSISFRADVDADTVNAAGQEITLTASAVSGSTSISVDRTTGSIGGNAFTAGEWVHIANGATRKVQQIAAGYTTGLSIPLTAALTYSFPGSPQPATVRSVETITYDLNGTDLRRNGSGIVEKVTGLTFIYYDKDGLRLPPGQAQNPPPCPAPGPNPTVIDIREIRIDLKVQGADGSGRCMTTRVKLRSLS